jgi:hypothetical protein
VLLCVARDPQARTREIWLDGTTGLYQLWQGVTVAQMATGPGDFYPIVYEVAKGSIARAREGAAFIEKAAAGIATVYAAILGVAFSVTDNPLPLRGVLPAVFLGLALLFAACFLAYPGRPSDTVAPPAANAGRRAWFNAFADWMSHLTLYRARFLRTALLSLLFGLVFLPTPFIAVKTSPADPPAQTEWPSANGNADLEKIKYRAQVNEVAKLREKAAPQPKGEHKIREGWIWGGAGIALLCLVISLVLPVRRGRQATTGKDHAPKDTLHPVPYFHVPGNGD